MRKRVALTRERVRLVVDDDPAAARDLPYIEAVPEGVSIPIEPPGTDARNSAYHVPTPYTRRQVELMTAYRLRHDEIAHIIGVSPTTLRKYYEKELEFGTAKVMANIAHRAFDWALRGDGPEAARMLIFLLKTRGGFVEQVSVNHSGVVSHEHSSLTHEERAARILQVLNAATVGGSGQVVAERLRAMVAPARPADTGVLQLSG